MHWVRGIYGIIDGTADDPTAQLNQMLSEGLGIVQLRMKSTGQREFLERAEVFRELTRRHGARLIINDDVDIARAVAADGVHLGQADMRPEDARAVLGASVAIGFSCHSVAQVEAASPAADYLALGPIFTTASKLNAEPTVGVDALRAAADRTAGRPLVAIGGINMQRIATIHGAGADALAMIGALRDNPGAATLAAREAWKRCEQHGLVS